jgi:D-alanine-D-alanine ligase
MRNQKPRVVVFFGGDAGSHDLSQETGHWVCNYIPRSKYQVTPVRVTTDGKWQVPMGGLPQYGPVGGIMDHLFEAVPATSPSQGMERLLRTPIDSLMTTVRGQGGDDGALHGLGSMLSVPVVGSSLKSCQQTSDKHVCAQNTADIVSSPLSHRYSKFDSIEDIKDDVRESFMPPLFVKPVGQEGSFGVIAVDSLDELGPAIKVAQQVGDVLIQERVDGTEVSVSMFNDRRGGLRVLPPTIVVPEKAMFYDHLAKRRAGRVKLHTPVTDSNPLLNEVEEIARDVYEELDCQGLVSMDMIIGDDSTQLLEVNTVPTLTTLTPLRQQLKVAGVRPNGLFDGLIKRSLEQG